MPHRLLVVCPDRPGIVAGVSHFLFEQGANIVHSDQHTSREGRFFLRVEFESAPADLGPAFGPVAGKFGAEWRFVDGDRPKRLVVFVSKEDHCLQELLWHQGSGDLPAEVIRIVSNHPDLEGLARQFGVSYHHVPVDGREEAAHLELTADADLLVLARYMRILSGGLLARMACPAINIHHSFLPAFAGANPYRQAYERGVKLIGATAHYVTAELDQGPIVAQEVQPVDHRMAVADLRRVGRLTERLALAHAVRWHCEDRVLLDGDRTVVFR